MRSLFHVDPQAKRLSLHTALIAANVVVMVVNVGLIVYVLMR